MSRVEKSSVCMKLRQQKMLLTQAVAHSELISGFSPRRSGLTPWGGFYWQDGAEASISPSEEVLLVTPPVLHTNPSLRSGRVYSVETTVPRDALSPHTCN
jgi:hypothetical protein